MKALSIRQPWAWLILRPDLKTPLARLGGTFKTVENRTWATSHRGPLLIHAALAMTVKDYKVLCRHIDEQYDIIIPDYRDLERGGIVGRVDVVDCVRGSSAGFATPGHVHWILKNPEPLPFQAMRGSLGIFNVEGH